MSRERERNIERAARQAISSEKPQSCLKEKKKKHGDSDKTCMTMSKRSVANTVQILMI